MVKHRKLYGFPIKINHQSVIDHLTGAVGRRSANEQVSKTRMLFEHVWTSWILSGPNPCVLEIKTTSDLLLKWILHSSIAGCFRNCDPGPGADCTSAGSQKQHGTPLRMYRSGSLPWRCRKCPPTSSGMPPEAMTVFWI